MRLRLGMVLLWTALIGFDTAAQLLYKLAAHQLDRPEFSWGWLHLVARSPIFWAATLSLSMTFPIWMVILRRAQLSLAFPGTALTYIGVIGGSQLIFGESIDAIQYAGILLIVVGVAILRGAAR